MDWPINLHQFAAQGWFLQGNTPGVLGLNGRGQWLDFENRTWVNRITVNGIWFKKIPEFSAFIHDLRGPKTIFRLPVCNTYSARRVGNDAETYEKIGVATADIVRGYLPFENDEGFDDGTGFALPDISEPTVLTSASAGESNLRLSGWFASTAIVGTKFTIDDFLYEIATNVSGNVRINPPLRQDVLAGTTAELSNPWVKVRLASDDDARLFVDGYRFGAPTTFNVIEAFDR